MATYTSTQDGAWNTDATWGGGGHPDTNADVVNIGHKVTYDAGESAVTWGTITVNNGGMLCFPNNANSDVIFPDLSVLAIAAGGEIRTGTVSAAANMDADKKLRILWAQGAAIRNVWTAADGGIINIWGTDCPATTRYADLKADWTSGNTLYVKGDYTAKWKATDRFWIFRNPDTYGSYQTDGDTYLIDSIGAYDAGNDRTPVVVSVANPVNACTALNVTTGWQSTLVMFSRNVELGDPGCSFDVYSYNSYTERIQTNWAQTGTNNLISLKNCMFYGWYGAINGVNVLTSTNYIFENLSIISSVFAINNLSASNATIDSINNINVCGPVGSLEITGKYCSNTSMSSGATKKLILYGDFISNGGIFSSATVAGVAKGNFIGNGDHFAGCSFCTIEGNIKAIGAFTTSNAYNGLFKGDVSSIGSPIITRRIKSNIVLEESFIAGANKRPLRIYSNTGVILSLISTDAGWQAPPSGNSYILEVTPNSYCSTDYAAKIPLSPLNDMAFYALAASTTLTFKIYPVGWTTSLTQADVVLEVCYLDSASGVTRTTVYNTSQTYANDGWRDCSVTFTPGQAGVVYFQLYFTKYESGDTILVDPGWSL